MLTRLFALGTLEDRLEAISPFRQPFQQVLDGVTSPISIEEVRAFQKSLSLTPTTKDLQYHLILEAQTLSLPAQQALLKLLEEPPQNTQIILTVDKPSSLLPTILSRTQLTKLKLNPHTDEALALELLRHISSDNYGQLINYASTLKGNAIPVITATITKLRSSLSTSPTLNRSKALKHLNQALVDLRTNLNEELALQHLLFSLKDISK